MVKKPVIIAICGKSASGKDTLARLLLDMLRTMEIPSSMIVSDTTRPPRFNERNGIDYNFLTYTEFFKKMICKKYLEYSSFNRWRYGTDYNAINCNNINIGVFNIKGIDNLAAYQDKYEILCVYLKCDLCHRIWRSIKREGCFKREYLRRALADNKDFKNILNILKKFPNHLIFNSAKISTFKMANHIALELKTEAFTILHNKL